MNVEAELLATVRAWFDVWSSGGDRLGPSQAVHLPEFKPVLAAMIADFDARHGIE